MMDYKKAMDAHYAWRGKIEVTARAAVDSRDALSLAYTPGVAEPCLAIKAKPGLSYELTRRWNTVAVITDGTAVLGLGDIGPEASMPVMEGKCVLFKSFGGIDAIPLCVRSKDADEIVRTVSLLAGSFGGINLEDISAPRCFEIERRLKAECDIPVFHDDQHGTAVIALAGLKNALKLTGRSAENVTAVICGAGAAGNAIARLMLSSGFKNIIMCDRAGIISRDEKQINGELDKLAAVTNPGLLKGNLADAMRGADIFIGVSAAGIVTEAMVRSMAKDAIVFAMANPVPEIMPELARAAGARIIATGRSDYPNQINNVLAFPGIFRGALDARAKDITEAMELAAADALANFVTEPGDDYIIPSVFDKGIAQRVADAVREASVR